MHVPDTCEPVMSTRSLCLAQMSELRFNRSGAFMETQLNTNVLFAEAQPFFFKTFARPVLQLEIIPKSAF